METISIPQKKENTSNYQIQRPIHECQLINNLKNKMKLQVLFQKFNPISQVRKISSLPKLVKIIKRDSSI